MQVWKINVVFAIERKKYINNQYKWSENYVFTSNNLCKLYREFIVKFC